MRQLVATRCIRFDLSNKYLCAFTSSFQKSYQMFQLDYLVLQKLRNSLLLAFFRASFQQNISENSWVSRKSFIDMEPFLLNLYSPTNSPPSKVLVKILEPEEIVPLIWTPSDCIDIDLRIHRLPYVIFILTLAYSDPSLIYSHPHLFTPHLLGSPEYVLN